MADTAASEDVVGAVRAGALHTIPECACKLPGAPGRRYRPDERLRASSEGRVLLHPQRVGRPLQLAVPPRQYVVSTTILSSLFHSFARYPPRLLAPNFSPFVADSDRPRLGTRASSLSTERVQWPPSSGSQRDRSSSPHGRALGADDSPQRRAPCDSGAATVTADHLGVRLSDRAAPDEESAARRHRPPRSGACGSPEGIPHVGREAHSRCARDAHPDRQ